MTRPTGFGAKLAVLNAVTAPLLPGFVINAIGNGRGLALSIPVLPGGCVACMKLYPR